MQKEAPLVSVLIPAFNRVNLIEETVRSVLTQNYPHLELIVVDDGSTDGTYELLESCSKQGNLTLLTHDGRANKGQSAALNLGLRNAHGKYICILDSDDLFLPGKISTQVAFLERNPDIGLVYGMGEAVDDEGNWLYDIHSEDHVEPNDPNAVLVDCYFLLPQNSMVRRSVYDQVGYFEESYRAAQDHDMLIRIAEVADCAFIPVKLFQYRRHSNSISSRGAELRWETGFRILERAADRYPYKSSTLRRRKAVLHFRMAQIYWARGVRIRALLELLRSGVRDPIRAFNVILSREAVR